MSREDPPIGGSVASGFEPVRRAFENNFTRGDELGAAVAAYHNGENVVDLWGGYRDTDCTAPWTEETLVLVFSATKGVAAAGMAHAHSAGLFDFDDRVAEYWPAFGVNGKDDVTIRDLLNHRAGVAAIDGRLTPADLADRQSLLDRLAAKDPDWTPGTRHGYHAFSLGWYASEVLRQADPEGRRLPTYLQQELLSPLDAEFYIGLPRAVDSERVAEVESFGVRDLLTNIQGFPPRMLLSLANPWSLTTRALSPFEMSSPAALNAPEWRQHEIPAGNGIGRVRDLARLYGDLAVGGDIVGLDAATFDELRFTPPPPPGGSTDMVLKTETLYSLGYWKPFAGYSFGSSAAFGAPGAGGAFAFADPERGVGFAYAPNRMGTRIWDDPREAALRDAVLDCLDAHGSRTASPSN
ncbi:serine hydrolase domain-containing protein [Natrinema salaciae]|uniref:CubicO group peptidase, beta-lactamase class C family n=1 Tax=Natrinema salaciae TaxID=1186196 RepID=A0A1H9P616_9EURY|nr:serine hydrolase domain-containing protein [Natrinema salaciae]SER43638.1 CubicO group peptidase, beta-lactamase class C family [Natrinema salaciae]